MIVATICDTYFAQISFPNTLKFYGVFEKVVQKIAIGFYLVFTNFQIQCVKKL